MTTLYLTEAEVAKLLDIRTAVDVVEEAFTQLAAGTAHNVPRQRARGKGIVLHTLSAAADYLNLVGCKTYTTTAGGARFHLSLYDAQTGELVLLCQADQLGRLRTGAATAVAAEWLAPAGAQSLGLFGTGKQAETQLSALCLVREIKQAFIYSRDAQRRNEFAERMTAQLNVKVIPVDRPQEAVSELPIIVTATTSRQPVFDGADLAEEAFVAAVGSNALNRSELDCTTLRRADTVVCDSIDACRNEAGDFVEALEKGHFDWSRAVDLAQVVAGQASGHFRRAGITVFKSVGLAIEDVALGAVLLERAKQQHLGTELLL